MRPTQKQYRSAAKRMFHDEGTIEVDERAALAHVPENQGGDRGSYVAAWVWVPADEAAKEKA
jgi:hypothetical protein